jgi:hypothetical protein
MFKIHKVQFIKAINQISGICHEYYHILNSHYLTFQKVKYTLILFKLIYFTLFTTYYSNPSLTMTPKSQFERIGMPRHLAWGYLGILIFMMGDGVEQGWLSPYLLGRGMTIQQSASLFTVYGITIAISSWFSGVLAEGYGPRKAMLMGILLYVIGTIGFVGLGMEDLNFPVMLLTYAVRGFGYPLVRLLIPGMDHLSHAGAKAGPGGGLVLVCIHRRPQCARRLLFQLGHRQHWLPEHIMEFDTLGFCSEHFFALVLNKDQFPLYCSIGWKSFGQGKRAAERVDYYPVKNPKYSSAALSALLTQRRSLHFRSFCPRIWPLTGCPRRNGCGYGAPFLPVTLFSTSFSAS